MVVAGVICLLLAVGCAVWAWFENRAQKELAAVETSTCAELRALADAVAAEAGAGSFALRCEIVGLAKPSGGEPHVAPFSKQPAVWYRSKVLEEYYDWRTRGSGNNRRRERVKRTRTLEENVSDTHLLVHDGSGHAVIDPSEIEIEGPELVHDVYDRHDENTALNSLATHLLKSDQRLGIIHKEWIIRPDTQLFVQGEVTDGDGTLRVRKPEKGTFRVSLKSEQELVESAAFGKKLALGGAALLTVAGAALVTAGIVAG